MTANKPAPTSRQWDALTPGQQTSVIIDTLMLIARVDARHRGMTLADLVEGTPELHHEPGTYRLVWPNGVSVEAPEAAVAFAVARELNRRAELN